MSESSPRSRLFLGLGTIVFAWILYGILRPVFAALLSALTEATGRTDADVAIHLPAAVRLAATHPAMALLLVAAVAAAVAVVAAGGLAGRKWARIPTLVLLVAGTCAFAALAVADFLLLLRSGGEERGGLAFPAVAGMIGGGLLAILCGVALWRFVATSPEAPDAREARPREPL